MIKTGFFDLFKPKEKKPKEKGKQGLHNAPTMTGNAPFYTSFGESIYASDIIVQAIRCKANEFKKLDPRHIRTTNAAQEVIHDSSIARVLKRPNAYMTQADFLEKITILLELTKNVFIYPTWYRTKGGEKYYTGLYPLKPSEAQYLADDAGVLYIKFRFANGYEVTLPADSVIHWRKDYGVNDYFGGGMFGGNDDAGLLTMLERYDQLTQSIAKAIEISCNVNAVVKYNSYNDTEELKKEREKFVEDLQSNASGVLFTDLSSEFEKIPRDIKLVDAETVKFFRETILYATGTSLAILSGDYSKAQKEAYYESVLQPDIKSLGQAISRVIFSDREASHGNEIVLYPNAIEFMTMSEKIAYMQVAVPAGALSINRILAFGGFPPVAGGDARPRGFNSLDADESKTGDSDTGNEVNQNE